MKCSYIAIEREYGSGGHEIAKMIAERMNLPFYDPLLIVEKTQGRMEGDHQWIMILKKEQ